MLATPPYRPAMQGLVSRIATDADLWRVYRDQVVQPRHARLAPVIAAHPAGGQLGGQPVQPACRLSAL